MNDCGSLRSARQAEGIDDKVICPMPRRVAAVTFTKAEVLKPFWQQRSMSPRAVDCEANHEILEIFLSKNSCGNSPSFGCSPPYFTGSPPCRAGNPLVRDVEFSHQRPLPAPVMAMQSKSAAVVPTYRASPRIRVEGFDCSGRGFECTGRDTRCRVPALA